jgi:hypothetical protein
MEEPKKDQLYAGRFPKLLRLYFSISLGIFLFFLFYEPVDLVFFDNNNKLLFYAGLGGISFFFLYLFLIVIPRLLPGETADPDQDPLLKVLLPLLIWITSSVAYVFYIRYVGQINMTMYLVFKLTLLCLLPPVIVHLDNLYYLQKQQLKVINEKFKKLTSLLNNSERRLKQTETFISENKSEKINLQLDDIIVIKSADNYVDVVFREGDNVKQKLIRNTLRNIEAQLMIYPDFIRCHRTCIVNIKQTDNLFYSYKGYRLSVPDYSEEVPVSRQYIMKVKEAMEGAVLG